MKSKDKPYKIRVQLYADVIGWGKDEEDAYNCVSDLASTGDFTIEEMECLGEIKKTELKNSRRHLDSSRHEYKYLD